MERLRDDIDRREQVLDAARQCILETGTLPVSMNDVAEKMGVSRSLLYFYFEGVPQMADCLFQRYAVEISGLVEQSARSEGDFGERLRFLFRAYLAHIIEHGPLINIMLRERNMDSPLGEESRAAFRSVLRMLSQDVSQSLEVTAREAFVLLELLSSIPEGLARLQRAEGLPVAIAEETCDRLVLAAIEEMRVRQD